eukprot:1186394-Prorocentrum_minimum.AAC.6
MDGQTDQTDRSDRQTDVRTDRQTDRSCSALVSGEDTRQPGRRTCGEKRGRVSGVLRAPLPLLAQEDP